MVTIVAIFLALGVGVLTGTTVLDQKIVKTLQQNTDKAERKAEELSTQVDQFNAFLDLAVPRLVERRLAHLQVVLVSDANADGGALSAARSYLDEAGADIVAELRVTNGLDPEDLTSRGLAQILDADPSVDPLQLIADAARELAGRLQLGPGPQVTSPGAPHDLLGELLSGGYLLPGSSPPNLQDVGGADQAVVIVAGGQSAPAAPYEGFMLPFVEALVGEGMTVVAGEPTRSEHPFVAMVRSDSTIPDEFPMVTVDDLAGDSSFGGVALVLGLKELLLDGQGGDYGVKDGASDGLIPKLP